MTAMQKPGELIAHRSPRATWHVTKSGKVREIYESPREPDAIVVCASDRVSAYDKVLQVSLPGKGKYLTLISSLWFDLTKDLVPNAVITTDVAEMGKFFDDEKFYGRVTKMKKLRMLPVECIVRGYLMGTALELYQKGEREICGVKLADGMKPYAPFPEPIFTPTTKAEAGEHDENIDLKKLRNHLADYLVRTGAIDNSSAMAVAESLGTTIGWSCELAKELEELSIRLYQHCAEYARARGLILVDTKFEFGLDEDDNLVLADEVCTPDSSRFWDAAAYDPESGVEPSSFDKQIIRNEIKRLQAVGQDVTLSPEILDQAVCRYAEVYARLKQELD